VLCISLVQTALNITTEAQSTQWLHRESPDPKFKSAVDTIERFGYSKLALHTTRGPAYKSCGKAASMQDYYSSCVGTVYQPSSLYLSQFLQSQVNHSSDPGPDSEILHSEPRERRTALVVDDVADVTEMLAVVLTHAGYSVVTAASAPAALKAARERQFDVIISDIGMPEMNGYQLAREVRQLPGYQTVPMVAVTGYSMFDDKERSTNAGFNAHMTKPIDPRALLDLIEQL
jgi:CheY-like chemotaxis protein